MARRNSSKNNNPVSQIFSSGRAEKLAGLFWISLTRGKFALISIVVLLVIILSSSPQEAPIASSIFSPQTTGASILIPDIFQLQTMLCEAGYKCSIDGILGKETLSQWDSYINQREASQYDHYYEVQK